MTSRWIGFIVAIAVGVGLGLLYGWVFDPVEYLNTSPTTLKIDYKADYVLMVAETFHADRDLPGAARRMALIQEMPLSILAQKALLFAQRAGYANRDLELLQELYLALNEFETSPAPNSTSEGISTRSTPAGTTPPSLNSGSPVETPLP